MKTARRILFSAVIISFLWCWIVGFILLGIINGVIWLCCLLTRDKKPIYASMDFCECIHKDIKYFFKIIKTGELT